MKKGGRPGAGQPQKEIGGRSRLSYHITLEAVFLSGYVAE
jgi:hypothetical protein